MSELHDIRTKIPTHALSLIHALEIATGETGAEIARKWITERAEAELHKASVICRVMKGEGKDGANGGSDE